jgi:hypothetical protein
VAVLRTTLAATGGSTTGIEVPEDVVLGLDRGKRVPVVATIGAHSWRTSIAPYRGSYWVAVSAADRAAAGIAAGDAITVDLVPDDAPRTVEVPADLTAAIADAGAADAWAALSVSKQKAHVASVEGAKTETTRTRRLAAVLEALGVPAAG